MRCVKIFIYAQLPQFYCRSKSATFTTFILPSLRTVTTYCMGYLAPSVVPYFYTESFLKAAEETYFTYILHINSWFFTENVIKLKYFKIFSFPTFNYEITRRV